MKIIILTKDKKITKKFCNLYLVCSNTKELPKDSLDLCVVMFSYPEIISRDLLSKYCFFNVHNSLLPKYRGLHAFAWAMISGENQVGYTLHLVDKGIDTGPIISQLVIPIKKDEDINAVFKKANKVVFPWLKKELRKIEKFGVRETIDQDESKSSYFKKRTPDDGKICWNKNAREIHNFCRALTPPYTPGAFSFIDSKKVIIIKTNPSKMALRKTVIPGGIIEINKYGLYVACKDSVLLVKKVFYKGRCLSAEKLKIFANKCFT